MLVQLAQLSIAISGHAFLWLTVCWLAASAFWLWTLIDCLVSGRVRDRTKLVWVLVLLGTYVVGAAAYLLAVRIRKLPPPKG